MIKIFRSLILSIMVISMMSAVAFAEKPIVAVVKGKDIDAVVRKAVELAGGMESKVKKWDRVVIKVSLDEDKPAGSGLVTNPEVVRTIVRLCKDAGARRVTIVDGSLRCNTWKAFETSGFSKMAREEGAQLKDLDSDQVWRAWLPDGEGYKKYSVATTILNNDVFINVPVIKEDDETSPSLALKNMLGIIDDKWFKRRLPKGADLDALIIDINLIKQADLVIIDGTSYGNMVIAGSDNVSADTVACKLIKLDPNKIGYIKMAAEKGLGINDTNQLEIKSENL
jgi:uncharacterized protein (DUF362 family)